MKYLTKFSFLALIVLIMFSITSCNCIEGEGYIELEQREVEGFNKISLGINAKVILTQDTNFFLRVDAQPNILEMLKTDVQGKTLKIGYTGEFWNTGADGVDETGDRLLSGVTKKLRNLTYCSAGQQRELIQWGLQRLAEAGADKINAFRAGGFCANRDTLRAVADNKLTFDTSYKPRGTEWCRGHGPGRELESTAID